MACPSNAVAGLIRAGATMLHGGWCVTAGFLIYPEGKLQLVVQGHELVSLKLNDERIGLT